SYLQNHCGWSLFNHGLHGARERGPSKLRLLVGDLNLDSLNRPRIRKTDIRPRHCPIKRLRGQFASHSRSQSRIAIRQADRHLAKRHFSDNLRGYTLAIEEFDDFSWNRVNRALDAHTAFQVDDSPRQLVRTPETWRIEPA